MLVPGDDARDFAAIVGAKRLVVENVTNAAGSLVENPSLST